MTEIEQELPNLDYAFLAEFARVDANGTLTAVGASFTHTIAAALPMGHLISVGGRVRMAENGPSFPLAISFKGPEPSGEITLELLIAHEQERPYAGRVGVLFTATTIVPLMSEGLHEVTIRIDSREVRRLAFSVSLAPTLP